MVSIFFSFGGNNNNNNHNNSNIGGGSITHRRGRNGSNSSSTTTVYTSLAILVILTIYILFTEVFLIGPSYQNNLKITSFSSFTKPSTSTSTLPRFQSKSRMQRQNNNNNYNNNNHHDYDHYYIGSILEDYVIEHSTELGYDKEEKREMYFREDSNRPFGCAIWKDPNSTNRQMFNDLTKFRNEMKEYQKRVMNFQTDIQDLRLHLDDTYYDMNNNDNNQEEEDEYNANDDKVPVNKSHKNKINKNICDTLNLDDQQEGIENLFTNGLLSQGIGADGNGYMEPLLPPMRDPEFCFDRRNHLLSLDYIVHDFAAMCRKLKRTSRIIFIDMGASLQFHKNFQDSIPPTVYITTLYQKFGFHFDHIYAFEVKPILPQNVFEKVPMELMAAYHWMNVPVSEDPNDKFNPLKSILLESYYNEDDFIIIKLDIDTPHVEIPLAYQILNDDRLSNLIDAFYFEHHVHMQEIARNWVYMNGTISESLRLFRSLREKGIAAHFWV